MKSDRPGILARIVSPLLGRLTRPKAGSHKLKPLLGEILKGSIAGIPSGPWHDMVKADWLGPFTPNRIPVWQMKIMRRDPQLSLGLSVIRSAYFSLEWHVRGGNPTTRAFVRKTVRESPLWNPLLRTVLNGLEFGYQAAELIWGIEDVFDVSESGPGGFGPTTFPKHYVLKDLSDLDPAWVRIKVDTHGRFVGIVFNGTQQLPANKMLLSNRRAEFRNWYGKSLLLPAYLPWYWSNWLYAWLMRYAEARIVPPIIATAPWDVRQDDDGDSTQPGINALEIAVKEAIKLRNGSVAGLPFEPDEQTGKNKFALDVLRDVPCADQFLSIIVHMQALKMRAIGVPEKTTQQDKQGSYAMADVHLDVFLGILEEMKKCDITPALNEVATSVVRANFGRSAPVPYFEGSELARQKQQILQDLLKAGFNVPYLLKDGREVRPLDQVDWTKVLEASDIPLKGSPEEVAQIKVPVVDPAPTPTAPPPVNRLNGAGVKK